MALLPVHSGQRGRCNALGCWGLGGPPWLPCRAMNRDAVKAWGGLALQHRLADAYCSDRSPSVYRGAGPTEARAVPAQSQTRPSDGRHPNEDLPLRGASTRHKHGANTWAPV